MTTPRIVCECPKCGKEKAMTRHHIYPIRHFGKGKHNKELYLLCRTCHDNLERLIPFEVMPVEFYSAVIQVFLIMED